MTGPEAEVELTRLRFECNRFPDKPEFVSFDALGHALRLYEAAKTHRSQKADDRCKEDDDKLYEAIGDGVKCDRRVGDKEAMLANCARFIERRCEGGHWPSYADLERRIAELETVLLGSEIGDDGLPAVMPPDVKKWVHDDLTRRMEGAKPHKHRCRPLDVKGVVDHSECKCIDCGEILTADGSRHFECEWVP